MGQTKTVLVYRLMIKGSAEEKIFQAGKKKLVLDHLIVQTIDEEEADAPESLESILRYGAKALFEEGTEETASDIRYTEADIDSLLDRSEQSNVDQVGAGAAGPSLSFNYAKVWERKAGEITELEDEEEGTVVNTRMVNFINEDDDEEEAGYASTTLSSLCVGV